MFAWVETGWRTVTWVLDGKECHHVYNESRTEVAGNDNR